MCNYSFAICVAIFIAKELYDMSSNPMTSLELTS
jgi:hypothetical protein